MMAKEIGDATERRRPLTEEEIEAIKNQLLNSIYADIGKSVIKKFLWIGGSVVVGAFAALSAFGHIKIGG
jgi:hypothetical protein